MAKTKTKKQKDENIADEMSCPLPRYPDGLFNWGMNHRKLKQYWQEFFERLYDWHIQNDLPLPRYNEKREDYTLALASLAADFQKYHYDAAIEGLQELMIFETLCYVITFIGMIEGAEDYEIKETWPTRKHLDALLQVRFAKHLDNLPVRPTRGGNRRGKENLPIWKRMAFTSRVDTVMPLWKYLISMLEKYEYEEDIWDFLKSRGKFISLCKECYVEVGDPILEQMAQEASNKRKKYWAKGKAIPEDLSAKAFALYQAAKEADVKGSYWVLEKIWGANRHKNEFITLKAQKGKNGLEVMFIENKEKIAEQSSRFTDRKEVIAESDRIEKERRRRYLTANLTKKK